MFKLPPVPYEGWTQKPRESWAKASRHLICLGWCLNLPPRQQIKLALLVIHSPL